MEFRKCHKLSLIFQQLGKAPKGKEHTWSLWKKCLFQFDKANIFVKEWQIKTSNYISLSDHPPIINKNTLIGDESILHGNVSGIKLLLIKRCNQIKKTKLYNISRKWSLCKCWLVKCNANPPKENGVWVLCSPLAFFIIEFTIWWKYELWMEFIP